MSELDALVQALLQALRQKALVSPRLILTFITHLLPHVQFLVGRDGAPFKRYGSAFDAQELARDVEALLSADPTAGGGNAEL